MEHLETLFWFINGLLPESTAAAALALAPVVVAFVGLLRMIPAVERAKQWAAPLLSIALGFVAGWSVAPGDWRTALPAGILVGLAAIGGFSGTRNIAQAVTQEDE